MAPHHHHQHVVFDVYHLSCSKCTTSTLKCTTSSLKRTYGYLGANEICSGEGDPRPHRHQKRAQLRGNGRFICASVHLRLRFAIPLDNAFIMYLLSLSRRVSRFGGPRTRQHASAMYLSMKKEEVSVLSSTPLKHSGGGGHPPHQKIAPSL